MAEKSGVGAEEKKYTFYHVPLIWALLIIAGTLVGTSMLGTATRFGGVKSPSGAYFQGSGSANEQRLFLNLGIGDAETNSGFTLGSAHPAAFKFLVPASIDADPQQKFDFSIGQDSFTAPRRTDGHFEREFTIQAGDRKADIILVIQ